MAPKDTTLAHPATSPPNQARYDLYLKRGRILLSKEKAKNVSGPFLGLQLESVHPYRQEGFSIREQPGELIINTLFEGKLIIKIRFSVPG